MSPGAGHQQVVDGSAFRAVMTRLQDRDSHCEMTVRCVGQGQSGVRIRTNFTERHGKEVYWVELNLRITTNRSYFLNLYNMQLPS